MKIEELYQLFLKTPQICTDTRKISQNSLFFALKGDNFNGNLFAEKAIELGAAYAIVDETQSATNQQIIKVEDVLQTLQDLACYHRKQLGIPILAITGTNGKTTTKELITSVLRQKFNVLSTQGNLNNHIGVPLTLLQITAQTQIAVVEMGANHPKEIETLCKIAKPNLGLITNIGKGHLEGFGSFEGVIRTKAELYDFIFANNGKIFLNSENSILNQLSQNFATQNKISYQITDTFVEANPFVTISVDALTINSNLVGKYNTENILAAICVGKYFGIEMESIKSAIENYVPQNNRSQLLNTQSNTLLLDAYNANPTSMKASIENFIQMQRNNKVVILGDMLELGSETETEHIEILKLLQNQSFKDIVLVGKNFIKAVIGFHNFKGWTFASSTEVRNWLEINKIQDSIVLIKGSRGIQLEKIIDRL